MMRIWKELLEPWSLIAPGFACNHDRSLNCSFSSSLWIFIFFELTLRCLCCVSEHARCYIGNQRECSYLLFKVNFKMEGGDVSIWIHYLISEERCSTRLKGVTRRRVGNLQWRENVIRVSQATLNNIVWRGLHFILKRRRCSPAFTASSSKVSIRLLATLALCPRPQHSSRM
jgi:hypothetical protein